MDFNNKLSDVMQLKLRLIIPTFIMDVDHAVPHSPFNV